MQYSYKVDKKNSSGHGVYQASSVVHALSEEEAELKVLKKYSDSLIRITYLRIVGENNNRLWNYKAIIKSSTQGSPASVSGTIHAPNKNEAIRNINGKYKETLVKIVDVQ